MNMGLSASISSTMASVVTSEAIVGDLPLVKPNCNGLVHSVFAFFRYKDEEASIKAGGLQTLMKNHGEQCARGLGM